jgi:serine/threonine protein kinase
MEFIPGETAEQYFEHAPQFISSGPNVTKFLLKALETLDAVHERGVIHRYHHVT